VPPLSEMGTLWWHDESLHSACANPRRVTRGDPTAVGPIRHRTGANLRHSPTRGSIYCVGVLSQCARGPMATVAKATGRHRADSQGLNPGIVARKLRAGGICKPRGRWMIGSSRPPLSKRDHPIRRRDRGYSRCTSLNQGGQIRP
jgi:hypothetical protein